MIYRGRHFDFCRRLTDQNADRESRHSDLKMRLLEVERLWGQRACPDLKATLRGARLDS